MWDENVMVRISLNWINLSYKEKKKWFHEKSINLIAYNIWILDLQNYITIHNVENVILKAS